MMTPELNLDESFRGENSLTKFQDQIVWFCNEDNRAFVLFPVLENDNSDLNGIGNLNFDFAYFSVNDSPSRYYLTLHINKQDDSEILFAFIRALASKIETTISVKDLIGTISTEYQIWRDFFGNGELKSENLRDLLGLFGELSFLKILVEYNVKNALSGWWGPFRNRHDFEFENKIFEIKSTVNAAKNEITVHGMDQLVDSHARQVNVVLMKFIPSSIGVNLENLIEQLCGLGLSKTELKSKVQKAGFNQERIESVSKILLEQIDLNIYEVDSSFPKVTSALLGPHLSRRISRLSYTLDLDGLSFKKLNRDMIYFDA